MRSVGMFRQLCSWALQVDKGLRDLGGSRLASIFEAALAETRLERNESQLRGHSERLHPVVHLELVVNVGEMKIDRPLGYEECFCCFIARCALCDLA